MLTNEDLLSWLCLWFEENIETPNIAAEGDNCALGLFIKCIIFEWVDKLRERFVLGKFEPLSTLYKVFPELRHDRGYEQCRSGAVDIIRQWLDIDGYDVL